MMGKVKFILAVAFAGSLLCLPRCAAAVVEGAPSYAGQSQQPPDQPKEKKKDKKKKGEPEPGPSDSADAAAAARRLISRNLRDFADGFEGHSPERVMDFLDENFEDLPRFEDAVTQFLERTSEMRINFRESTNEVKGDHATVIVDAEMIYTDKANPMQDQRRRQRIQFDFVYDHKKGWKILEITPRDFFEP